MDISDSIDSAIEVDTLNVEEYQLEKRSGWQIGIMSYCIIPIVCCSNSDPRCYNLNQYNEWLPCLQQHCPHIYRHSSTRYATIEL